MENRGRKYIITYKYKAITNEGKILKGTYNAKSENEVILMLRENKYYPANIQKIDKNIRSFRVFNGVKVKDIAIFCRQFYTMLNAGVTIVGCLDILRQQTENKKLKHIIKEIYEEVQKGLTLSETLKKHKNVFSDLLINMVEVGEVSGNLDIIMDRMAIYYEKEFKINNKIKSAMVYPIILSIAAVSVVVFLLTFVMPTFMEMFEGRNAPLPTSTIILLKFSNILHRYWYLLIIGFAIFIVATRQILNTEKGRFLLDKVKLKFPLIKRVTEKIVTSRFTKTLSTLSTSGVPLIQSLEITSNIVGNKIVTNGINIAKEEVRKGVSLSKAIEDIKIFPPMVISMTEIGEESGYLGEILEKTATFYDEELETDLQKLTTVIEPLVILIMALVIGFIVISMVLPMFDMFNILDI